MPTAKTVQIIDGFDNGQYLSPHGILICGYTFEEVLKVFEKNAKQEKDTMYLNALKSQEELFRTSYMAAVCCTMERTVKGITNRSYVNMIWVRDKFDFSDDMIIALAHEVLHLTQFFLPHYNGDRREYEAEAYYHTHVLTQCMKMLRGRSKKSRTTKKKQTHAIR